MSRSQRDKVQGAALAATFNVTKPADQAVFVVSDDGALTIEVTGKATHQSESRHLPEITFAQDIRMFLDNADLGVVPTYVGDPDHDWTFSAKLQLNVLQKLGPRILKFTVTKIEGSVAHQIEVNRAITIRLEAPPARSFAIILCRFRDKPTETRPADFYRDLYTRAGTGGMVDFWRTVTFNAVDLGGSQVFGWYVMEHDSTEEDGLVFPTERYKLVDWGIEAARANGVDLTKFTNVLVVHNWGLDHGFGGNGVIIIHDKENLCEYGFICHEMGHGLGLPHSFCANPDFEYGDGWDLMSFATTTFQFDISFAGASGQATVGLNARNLQALGGVPKGRMWQPNAPDFSVSVDLEPMNQAPMGNRGVLIAQVPAWATSPPRPNNSTYTIEFRLKAGWDRGIPENCVLIHEVRANGQSYLQPSMWGRFLPGTQWNTPDPPVFIQVASIDTANATATVRIWDVPEGSLRKEDSKPRVYLIQNGKKCWVTSPKTLTDLGKSWNDVRAVPDGGLASIAEGPELR